MDVLSGKLLSAYAAASLPAMRLSQEPDGQAGKPVGEEDRVTLSPEGKRLSMGGSAQEGQGADILSPEEKKQVESLKKTDREVRNHEAAHMAAGGGVVRSGAVFSYRQGPDGKRYAVGGEVKVDTSRGADPAATIEKMRRVKQAALAPANPSAQDRAVAAMAVRTMTQARTEMTAKQEPAQDIPGQQDVENTQGPEPPVPDPALST